MELFIRIACYVAGVVTTVLALFAYAWYLGMQERIRQAEVARKDMEDAIKAIEEQQKVAAEMLQNSITELVKRRGQQPPPPLPSPQANGTSVDASVKERLRKAVELTTKQAKIDTKKGPEFIEAHNVLELEKLSVLKTILADGFDPVITIRYNTGEQEMLLSSYVQSISKGLA
jgi:hypothetical protein